MLDPLGTFIKEHTERAGVVRIIAILNVHYLKSLLQRPGRTNVNARYCII
jgi:hypothetical protein